MKTRTTYTVDDNGCARLFVAALLFMVLAAGATALILTALARSAA